MKKYKRHKEQRRAHKIINKLMRWAKINQSQPSNRKA